MSRPSNDVLQLNMEPGQVPDVISPANKMDVAQRLKYARLALKLKQTRLCAITGIATNTWNNAENGVSRIGLDTAIQFCEATGVTLDWIYRGIKVGLPHGLAEALLRVEENPPVKKK
jgi:transcriptional regulator with XRE-family HTH domain